MITVADFTSDLEETRCVAGFNGTDREITSFTIVDTPDILDWLHGGEFVVDSGYITSRNPAMLEGFIASLKEKGCAALGIKLHRFHSRIPSIMVDDGNKLDFPIFELPYNLYFCDFAHMVYHRLFEDQMDDMYHVSIAYKDIVNSFSTYKVPERMMSELSLVLKNPVFLVNSQFELIEYSYGPNNAFSLENLLHIDTLTKLDANIQEALLKRHQQQPYQFHQFSVSGQGGELSCILISSGSIDGDTTFLMIPEINKLEGWHYKIIKDISALFQLADSRRDNVQDFAASVITAQSNSDDAIRRYCKMYNFDFTKRRICLAVDIDDSHSATFTHKYIIREMLSSITDWIVNTCGCQVFSLKAGSHYALYLLFSDTVPQEAAECQAAEAARRICHLFNQNNHSAYVGVSLYAAGLQQISKAFFQALDALKLGRKLYPEECVFLFRAIQVYQWLSTMPRENLEEMYRDTVEPLRKAGNEGVDYVQILRAYIGNHYNISKAAAHLHIHRNTMMNYLARIQELLPYDMGQPENMLKLQIGMHIMYLLDGHI